MNYRTLLAASAALITLASSAAAADVDARLDALERPMCALEEKLDRIIDTGGLSGRATNSDQSSQSAHSSNSENAFTSAPVVKQSAGLTLSLVIVQPTDDMYAKRVFVHEPPSNIVASEIVRAPGAFDYAKFTTIPSMSDYASLSGQVVGQLWTGVLDVPSSGDAEFVSGVRVAYDRYACVADLKIDDAPVVVVSANVYNGMRTEGGTASLSKGPHKFQYWTFCSGSRRFGTVYRNIHFDLRARFAGDPSPQPIDWNLFSPR